MSNSKRKTDIIAPKYFTGLHAHSGFSIGDGLNNPKEHIDFAIENGMDSLALTDHGNMNGFSHQYLHHESLKKKGVDFKALFGIECYFHSSLKDWQALYESEAVRKKDEKQSVSNAKKKTASKKSDSSSSYSETENEAEEIGDSIKEKTDEDLEGTSTIENEEESKSNKWKSPLYQRSHLVLLAKNDAGLKSLFQCVSKSFKDGFYKYPRMDFEMLKEHANGNIIASSACIGSPLAKIVFDNQDTKNLPDKFIDLEPNNYNFDKIQIQLKDIVERFQDTFGKENYYLELQFNSLNVQHLVNMHLIECSKRTGAPLIVTCDSHYANPKYWKEREIYKLMAQMGIMKKTPEELSAKIPQKIDELKCELYPKNAEQVWQTYLDTTGQYDFYDDKQVKDAIQLTHSIAHDQIGDVKMDKKVKLPAINKLIKKDKLEALISEIDDKLLSSDEDYVAFQQLKKDAIEGATWRKVQDKPEYIERLKEELSVIKKLKFSKYFLTYAKIMELLTKEMLSGMSRGSAGSSLLSYVLNITQIDPIKNQLLFARFLTSTKKSFPDIDSDISERNQALSLISNHFGEENVVPVSNFNQLQLRSLIKDVSKLQGLPFDEINMYTKKIEQEALSEAKKEPGFDAQQWELTFEEAEENSPSFRELMAKYPEIEKTVKILFKQIKTTSRHAGGIVLTDNAQNNMPVIKSGGVLQTPWQEGLNFRHLEGFGFLKFDILGLGTLRMIENCIRRILKKQGQEYVSFDDVKKYYYEQLHPDNNPMTDMKVYQNIFWESNYSGIFQFVQKNVQSFMARMKPISVLELAIATSIYRPGPLSISADKLYLKNIENPDKVIYKHPLLREVLEPTGGLVIFQEQLQLIYHKLAGVPLDQTDDIRKALLKKDKSNIEKTLKEQQRLRQDFIDRCLEVNQIPVEVSADIFDYMMRFVSYSFNKCLHFKTRIKTYTKDGKYLRTKSIRWIKPGDFVSSRDERTGDRIFVEILKNHNNGIKDLYEFQLDNGRKIKCTLDHKFRVIDGRMLPIKQILEEKLELSSEEDTCVPRNQCGFCNLQNGHKDNCLSVTGEENIDYVTCNICQFKGRNITAHLKLRHNIKKINYNGTISASESTKAKRDWQIGKINWVEKMKISNPELLLLKIIEMAKNVSKSILNNPKEINRRSNLMKNLWVTHRKQFTASASLTAINTSKKPEILKARTIQLQNWRNNNKEDFYNLCVKKMVNVNHSKPEIMLRNILQIRFSELNFSGNGSIFNENIRTTKTQRRQIDILSKEHKIIVEYDGYVHFNNIKLWNQLKSVQIKDNEFNEIFSKEYLVIRVSEDQFSYKKSEFKEDCLKQLFDIVSNHKSGGIGCYLIGENYKINKKELV